MYSPIIAESGLKTSSGTVEAMGFPEGMSLFVLLDLEVILWVE
jgi:hypothetical protein